MASSRRFRQMRSELRRLREHFLPPRWDPTGAYSERKLDRTRAYRILAHAEIEFFLENLLLDLVERDYNDWRTNKTPSHTMICLLAASKLGWDDLETESMELKEILPPRIRKGDASIVFMIDRAVSQYREIVKDNNGIKSKNLKRLIMPLGISLSDLDQIWLNDMNSFGGRRGFIAHTSRLGVTNLPDPRAEKQTVDGLLIGLSELDELVLQL